MGMATGDYPRNKRRIARVQISTERLKEDLGFPAGTFIQNARIVYENGNLELIVSHPDFPATAEGYLTPRATLVCERINSHWEVLE